MCFADPESDEIDRALCDEIDRALCDEIDQALCNEIDRALCDEIDRALCDEIDQALCDEIDRALCASQSNPLSFPALAQFFGSFSLLPELSLGLRDFMPRRDGCSSLVPTCAASSTLLESFPNLPCPLSLAVLVPAMSVGTMHAEEDGVDEAGG